ncbi:hypothetical protein SAY86_031678 [Trapa natans]|uniref:Uncharacterized protein n=1 Tax=Trapa natans TaxID=22666 RepID=A0AAN7LS88_TRANT|nr:hypothetical protein SAY86_031678 [Trapa natans]
MHTLYLEQKEELHKKTLVIQFICMGEFDYIGYSSVFSGVRCRKVTLSGSGDWLHGDLADDPYIIMHQIDMTQVVMQQMLMLQLQDLDFQVFMQLQDLDFQVFM